MIKLAYNKENPNLVFEINSVSRDIIGNKAGIIKRYVGVLKDVSTKPDTTIDANFKVDVVAFESKWDMVPADIGGVAPINNQDKEATPTTTAQTITPDTGYTGLSKVTVAAAPLEETTATPTTASQEIVATGEGKIGLSKVTVAAVTAAIDSNIIAENIKKDVVILGVTGTYEA